MSVCRFFSGAVQDQLALRSTPLSQLLRPVDSEASPFLCRYQPKWRQNGLDRFSAISTRPNHPSPRCKSFRILFASVLADLSITRIQKNPDDVVITFAIRTPLCKGFKGGLKDTPLDYIVYTLIKESLERSKIDPSVIEDVCLGNVRS